MNRPLSALLALTLPLALWSCGTTADQPAPLNGPALDKALAILQTEAHATDPAARAEAVEALQVSHDPRALDSIEQALHDPEPVVRFAAAMAAGQLKADRVRPVLNTMVATDPDPSVHAGCIFALRRLGDQTHMTELATLLESKDWQARANTALILGKLGEDSAISLLKLYADDPDLRVRFEITAAMARLGDDAAQKVVTSQSVDRFAEDQYQAMVVCGDLPESVGSSPLLLGLRGAQAAPPDVDPATVKFLTAQRQLVAARSLARMKYNSQEAAAVAIDNRANADPRLRALAALALGDMLSSRQAQALDKMLDDTDERVRRSAAAAVVNIFARAATGQ